MCGLRLFQGYWGSCVRWQLKSLLRVSSLPFSGVCTLAVIAPSEARLPLSLRGGWCQGKHHILRWWGGRGSRHRSFWHYSTAEHAQNTAHAQQQKHVSCSQKWKKQFVCAAGAHGNLCMLACHCVLLWHLSFGTDGTPSRIRHGPGRTAGAVTHAPAWTLSSGRAPLHSMGASATASTRSLFWEIIQLDHWKPVCS